MDIIFNPEYATMWSAIGTLTQGFASILLAIAAFIYSVTTFRKSLHTSHYTELDSMYFDLLKTALEKPHLVNKAITRLDDQIIEYDTYAFMVWNFIEAIYDRCADDKHLRSTWFPVIDAEDQKHRDWFNHQDNRHKFKEEFYDFIQVNRFKTI